MPKTVCITSADRAGLLARRNALVEANLDLARSIARHISLSLPDTFELDDLISTGFLGLLHAATRYRPSVHGDAPFSAYARPVIRGAILDSVRRRHYVENTRCSVSAMPEASVLHDIEGGIDRSRQAGRLAAAVSQLDSRHRRVIAWHYGGEERLPAVGIRLKVGKSRASQLHCEAVRELRSRLAAV
jgi:RNA polymerase sigma factor (sigma-70 family)